MTFQTPILYFLHMEHLYAVILAGGVGERFWPLSRKCNPKQFLDVFTGKPLLATTLDRMKGFIPDRNTIIITHASYVRKTRSLLKGKKGVRVVGEPVGKNTAAAIAVAAALISKEDPQGVMVILSADHIIRPVPVFLRSLALAARIAVEKKMLVCLGVLPAYAHTGLGYIETGAPAGRAGNIRGFQVKRFVEKPDLKKAQQYVRSGKHLWNCGIFVWSAGAILSAFEKYMPALHRRLQPLRRAVGSSLEKKAMRNFYLSVEKESIDYGVLEKSKNIVAVKSPMSWSDVGSWNAFKSLFKADSSGNLFRGNCVDSGSRGCLTLSDKGLTATLGLENIFVIRQGDALLIAKSDKTDGIKALLASMREKGNASYL